MTKIKCEICKRKITTDYYDTHYEYCLNLPYTYNWVDIQEYYNAGHTWRETGIKFKVQNTMLSRASKMGLFSTRTISDAMVLSQKQNPRTFDEKARKNISVARKKYLSENPDKVPYVMYHKSKGMSYPEKYFKGILDKHAVDYEYDYSFGTYLLDFAIVDKKIDIEVDGSQHKVDPIIVEHDLKRDKFVTDQGWTVIRIYWPDYQKLIKEEKEAFINCLLKQITDQ